MKDKEKQIKKIAKERNEIKDIMKLLDKCVSLNPMCKSEVASVIYGNNYRKLPEDSVVLSREEFKNYCNLSVENEVLKEEKEQFENDVCNYEMNLQHLTGELEQVRKETAEKIYTKIKDSFLMNSNNRYAIKLWIEEQFGLEIKE